jgi:hypothetical protein
MQHHEGTATQPLTYPHFYASGSVTILASTSSLDNDLTSSVAGRNGYDTENQRFLHICVSTTESVGAVIDVYAYNRQFGIWGQLKAPIRNNQANFYDSMINVQVSGSPYTTHYVSFPINGVDRVAFVSSNHQDVVLYVAGSTF